MINSLKDCHAIWLCFDWDDFKAIYSPIMPKESLNPNQSTNQGVLRALVNTHQVTF